MKKIGLKNVVIIGLFGVIVALAGLLLLLPAPSNEPAIQPITSTEYTVENCVADECLAVEGLQYPVSGLPVEQAQALLRSLEDTYTMVAVYTTILNELGEGMPFLNIIRTEQHYQAAQKALFDKYGYVIPENTNIGEVDSAGELTVQDACAVAFEREQESINLYKNDLLPTVRDYPDLLKVLFVINRASEELHLPALRACATAGE